MEIARLVQKEAARGVPLDRMAVVLRSPQVYSGLLETALRRAGVEAWFVRGTRAPDPAGRAFLALLACAAEQLSARRFSEYLSLGQVPEPDPEGAPPVDRARWVPPAEAEQVLPAAALPVQGSLFDVADLDPDHDDPDPGARPDADDRPVVGGTLRAPWHWDRLLVESAVIGGRDRWARRLAGLEHELHLRLEESAADDPRSPRARRLERDLVDLGHLRRFALPVMDRLDAFPHEAPWGDWLDRLEALAPMVLRRPDRVLATLGELRPMAGVGPVSLTEVQDVLAERLTELQAEPPARRYGRVFVGGPEHVRGRIFDVVFVPGLAERMFPQKPRQDPILLDDVRRRLNAPDAMAPGPGNRRPAAPLAARPTPPASAPFQGADADPLGLPVLDDRAAQERLRLRLAVGAAARRLHLSYSRLELGESRPRVPSFYALDLERARTGRVPDFADHRARGVRAGRVAAGVAGPQGSRRGHRRHRARSRGPRTAAAAAGRARAEGAGALSPGPRASPAPVAAEPAGRAGRRVPWSRYDGVYRPEAGARAALDAASADGAALLGDRPCSASRRVRTSSCWRPSIASSRARRSSRRNGSTP